METYGTILGYCYTTGDIAVINLSDLHEIGENMTRQGTPITPGAKPTSVIFTIAWRRGKVAVKCAKWESDTGFKVNTHEETRTTHFEGGVIQGLS